MINSYEKLHYIGIHKNAFEIDCFYPLDIFEQFVQTTGDCLIECSGKIKKDKLYPARFDLQFSDHQHLKNLNSALNFFKKVEARVDVKLNYELLEQFLGNKFDFSKVQTILTGVDLRPELSESRLKLFIRIGNYPEKVEVAKQLCGNYPELQKMIRYDTLLLVIEVVSPGEIQRDRDYIAKRIQYQDCRIPEYWIVDPQTETILVLELKGDTYTEIGNFSNDDLVKSPGFTELNLKVSEVFDKI